VIYGVVDGDVIKVGYTENAIQQRLAELQTNNPRPLKLLFLFPGARPIEKLAHRALKRRGLHIKGEWFRMTDEVPEVVWRCRGTFAAYEKDKHRGVKLLRLSDGRYVARYRDPVTGKQRQQSLNHLGLRTAQQRKFWAAEKLAELQDHRRLS
jgi:hypothetical protein